MHESAAMFGLDGALGSPVVVESIELLRFGNTYIVRTTSTDGAVGMAVTTPRISYLQQMLTERVIPAFIGRDARELESLVDDVYLHDGNYKLTGLPFWCCVAWVEFSLLDLLGNVARKSVGELLGGVRRKQVPVYLSMMSRAMAPPVVVKGLQRRIAETGARGVKVKIGGRMSDNLHAAGRTEKLIPLLRRELGPALSIYADANGSYDPKRAIEVGRMLEANDVGFFEEPCPFEYFDQTKAVTDTLSIPIAGGEQDTSLARWKEMLSNRVIDLPQPDLVHTGGFIRTARVARVAAAHDMTVSVHNPHSGPTVAYMLQFVSALPNAAAAHEVHAEDRSETWFEPRLRVHDGMLDVPRGPGLAVAIDETLLRRAERIKHVRRLARSFRGMFRTLVR